MCVCHRLFILRHNMSINMNSLENAQHMKTMIMVRSDDEICQKTNLRECGVFLTLAFTTQLFEINIHVTTHSGGLRAMRTNL